ncbi:MAG: class I SAM-dependent methyltransferase [bacterium]
MQKQEFKNQVNIPTSELKEQVKAYWNKASCGTEFIREKKFSKAYFEEIECFRYLVEPEIFAFAQFTRFHNKKVLEVGVGAGTDFVQWVRAGTQAHGVDLTQEAIDNVQHRLRLYNLDACDIRVADAEKLSYETNSFDLVYSWGVIHHSPDTIQCLREIIRVTKPGGTIKVMIYNRHSLFAFYRYLLSALFKGRPFKSFKKVLFEDQESPGTKAYTQKEVRKILADLPVTIVQIKATVSNHDLLYYKNKFIRFFAYSSACLLGWNRVGWFMTIELLKK